RRLSPAITRARSVVVAPHWFIHRRIGNQYSAANVRITRSVGSMGPSYCLWAQGGTTTRTSKRCSRCHPLRATISPLGKEIFEFVANDPRLTEHQVAARFEADKPSAADALGRALTRLVRGDLVVFGVDDQGWYANGFEVVLV